MQQLVQEVLGQAVEKAIEHPRVVLGNGNLNVFALEVQDPERVVNIFAINFKPRVHVTVQTWMHVALLSEQVDP